MIVDVVHGFRITKTTMKRRLILVNTNEPDDGDDDILVPFVVVDEIGDRIKVIVSLFSSVFSINLCCDD